MVINAENVVPRLAKKAQHSFATGSDIDIICGLEQIGRLAVTLGTLSEGIS
jgi:hypothetical protein